MITAKSKYWMNLGCAMMLAGAFYAAGQAPVQDIGRAGNTLPIHSRASRAFLRARAQNESRTHLAKQVLPRQSPDTSGNGMLNGPYFARQVLMAVNPATNYVTPTGSLIGIMTFDGKGNYSFSGQLLDTTKGSTAAPYTVTGQYGVQSNGLCFLWNPYDTSDTEFGAVGSIGPNAIVASATEGKYNDIFMAIPAGTAATNSSVQGSYQAGFIDFLQGSASNVRDGYFTMTSDGSGNLGNITVNGAMANQNDSASTSQPLSGVTYSISNANGSGTITFPTASDPTTALLSGQKTLYVSKDGNLLLGGSNNDFDLIVGMKSISNATNSLFNSLYFEGALENDASGSCGDPNCIDSFYGSVNATGQGISIYHLRIGSNQNPYDLTSDQSNNFGSDGTFNDGLFEWLLGDGGAGLMQIGTGTYYSLTVGIHAQQFSGSGVFLNPIGIVNAANFAPITNPIAPGEYVSLVGTGLASGTVPAPSLPLSTTLGGVQVMINGTPAPLLYVSSNLINAQVPFSTPANSYVTVQVINNQAMSNPVTVGTAVWGTAPGVYTQTSDGVGLADVYHADYSPVTATSPAVAGETLFFYATGLGAVSPAVGDGVAAPLNPLSYVTDPNFYVDILDQNGNYTDAAPVFQGLLPNFAAIYQINFTVPSGVASGLAYLEVDTSDGYTSEAIIYMK